MIQRFFRAADDQVYEQIRLWLDAAWNHQPPTTCITPADQAPRDTQGRIVLAVRPEFCEFSAVAETLPGLLASGAVEEITETEYRAAVQPPSPVS